MPPTSPSQAQKEHPLQSGYVLYVMRRQKHARSKAQKPTKEGAEGAATGAGEATTQAEVSAAEPQQQQQTNTETTSNVEDYEKLLKKVASFNTVEAFWRVYGHILHPNEIPVLTDVHIFREGIKPVWEDAANRRGGKLVIKSRKGVGARFWEQLLLAMIGEQFGDLGNEVCGAVISVRHNEDVISLWTRNADNAEALHRLKDLVRKCIKLPGFVQIDYKRHDTAAGTSTSQGGASGTTGSQNYGESTTSRAPAWNQSRGGPSASGGAQGGAGQRGGQQQQSSSDWRS